jgi:ribonuclease P protein component
LTRLIVIKKNSEFQTIFDQGHSIYGRYLVVYFLQTNLNKLRFGFCVGKKIGNAVTRNRIKRLLREAVRQVNFRRIAGYDLLLVARHSILKANLIEIIKDISIIETKTGNFIFKR